MTQHEERILMFYKESLMESVLKIDVPIYFMHGVDDLIINFELTNQKNLTTLSYTNKL